MTNPEYKSVVDVPGTVGQFLLNTQPDDLIIELIQNELDAGSTQTRIQVLGDRLVCEGDGRRVQDDGWNRLKYILAAGGEVAPKRDGIGAKNHGLRVAFWIGDTIWVQSEGRRTQLTTLRNSQMHAFLPGAWEHPVEDTDAPDIGTRISILYRRKDLPVKGVEGLTLHASDMRRANHLMTEMMLQAPWRLMGVTHATKLPHYTLELLPSEGPAVKFNFSCRYVGEADGHSLFERVVQRCDGQITKKMIARERAIRFPLRGLKTTPKTSWFFKGAKGPEAEVSWGIGTDNEPISARGALRYPIAYPSEAGAITEYGLHLSAPFVSDQARHAPASGGETNAEIIERAAEITAGLLARYLVPGFGPTALELVRSAGAHTPRTTALIKTIANLGGLPIIRTAKSHRARRRRESFHSGGKQAKWKTGAGPVVIPSSPDPAICRFLRDLLPVGTVQLHPDTPSFVVEAFVSGKISNIGQMFTSGDAIDRLCGTCQRFRWLSDAERSREFSSPDRIAPYLTLLNKEPQLVKARAEDIRRLALLPTSAGEAVIWETVSWAASDPPDIPGVSNHKIVHPKLRRYSLLRTAPLGLSRFNIDDRLSNLDWSNVVNTAREKYLTWLVKNARVLKHKTLRTIAQHPVFQAIGGAFHPFGDLCLIEDGALRQAMEGYLKTPAQKVLKLVKAKRSAFNMRVVPSHSEVRNWYKASFAPIRLVAIRQMQKRDYAAEPPVVESLDHIENMMDRLLLIGGHEFVAEMRDWGHQTLNKSGQIRSVYELHAPTKAVRLCGLSEYDLVGDRPSDIWRHLGIREEPSASAILRVMGDEADANTFFRRLSAFLDAGGDPAALTTVACIRTRAGMKIPSDVALRGRTSYWGDWKTTISVNTPERAQNLRRIGVLPAELREEDSRAFFGWLESRNDQLRYLTEIEKHWRERREGPLRWWRQYEEVACLPIVAGGRFLMTSYKQALARPVYLPDFPALKQQFADGESRTGVVHDRIVREFPELRKDGISSLREFLVGRGEITPINPEGFAEARHQEAMRYVQMAASGRRLIEELNRIGVARNKLKQDFLSVMAQLSEVRQADKILVHYRLGSATYETETTAGLDQNNTLWLIKGATDMALFEGLAERLFRAGEDVDTAPYKLFQAIQAVRANFELIVAPLQTSGGAVQSNSSSEIVTDGDVSIQSSAAMRSAPDSGHVPPAFGSPAVPNPTPFKTVSPEDFVASGHRSGASVASRSRTPARGSSSERRNTTLEDIEKTKLKRDNYAYHCQACLGLHAPDRLTPKYTYVWDKEYRNRNIEAHHVEHLQNNGALGAGNLVIMCQYHHDFLGDKLDRHEITRGLRTANHATRHFPADIDGNAKKSISGYIVDIDLDGPPYQARLFFTTEHASAWLNRAQDVSNEGSTRGDAAE